MSIRTIPVATFRVKRPAVLSRLAAWRETSRQRRQLIALSDEHLKDIGVTRSDARAEARRWAWDI